MSPPDLSYDFLGGREKKKGEDKKWDEKIEKKQRQKKKWCYTTLSLNILFSYINTSKYYL